MMSSYSLMQWWHSDRKILYLFALYGLVAGIITYIDSTSYEQDIFANISLPMNYPAFLMLFWAEWNLANPNGFSILSISGMIIPYSILIWSFIGLLAYSLTRMFKMGQ
jgi:disulfide bond formation protein DsbB